MRSRSKVRHTHPLHQRAFSFGATVITSFRFLVVAAVAFGMVPYASAATITFDSQPIVNYTQGQSFVDSNFLFTNTSTSANTSGMATTSSCTPSCATNGTTSLVLWINDPAFTISRVGGSAFNLDSFEGAESFTTHGAGQIDLLGTLWGGGTVSASFTLDQINDGTGPLTDFQAFVLPSTFQNLTSVRFTGTTNPLKNSDWFSVENIVVNETAAVPEPTSMLLLGTGLLAVGIGRWRRQGE